MPNSIARLSYHYMYSLLKLLVILCGCLLALRGGLAVHPLDVQSATASPQAVFQLVEQFDGLGVGSLDGQNGWHATSGITVASDPENAANRVMAVSIGDFQAYKALPTIISNANTGTLHFRLRRNGHMDGFAGASDLAAPNDWTSYETQFGAQVTHAANEFIVRDGAQFDVLGGSFNDQTWYCVWLVTNNASDTYQVYAKGGAFAQPTQLNAAGQTAFGFRNGGSAPLLTFLAGANSTSQGGFYIDDIYVDPTSQNLTIPGNDCGTIASTAGWQQTPLVLQPSNQFNIAYTSGTWTVDSRSLPYTGPDGYPPNVDSGIGPGCKVDTASPYAMLLGRVGNGAIFPVGLGGTFTADANGSLALRINDQDGCLSDNNGSIGVVITTLQIPPPSANFDAWPLNGQAPLTVSMHIVSIDNMTSCTWEYGDGATGNSCAPYHDHVYSAAGSYTVKFTASGPGGSDTKTRTNYIQVSDPAQPPTAGFSANPSTGVKPLTVNFTDQSTGAITTWSWNFGDGNTSTQQNPSHPYNNAGDYTVSLTVSGPGGSNTKTSANYIHVSEAVPPPIANFSASPLIGNKPLTVNFTNQSTGNISSWSWNFGDGGMSSEQSPSHIYTNTGNYTVALTVSGPGGSNTATKTNYIQVSEPTQPPTANFSASPTSGDKPLAVKFTDQSTGNITTWAWNFGDGNTSTQQSPAHTYTNAGDYTIALTVSGPTGTNTKTAPNYIQVAEPAPANGPSLSIPEVVTAPGSRVTLPAAYTAKGNNISSLLFSIDYDQTRLTFDPTDLNGDGIPDAVQFSSNLPSNIKTVSFAANDTTGELDFLIADLSASPRTVPDGVIFTITFVASANTAGAAFVNFTTTPAPSFGGAMGDIAGSSDGGSILITGLSASAAISASATTLTLDGAGNASCEISVVVHDAANNPVPNQNVTFTTTLGDIAPQATTDANGRAASTFAARGSPGTATVTVQAGNVRASINIVIQAAPSPGTAKIYLPVVLR